MLCKCGLLDLPRYPNKSSSNRRLASYYMSILPVFIIDSDVRMYLIMDHSMYIQSCPHLIFKEYPLNNSQYYPTYAVLGPVGSQDVL